MKKANEKEVTVQWLETKEELGEQDIDGDMEYVEGHVEDIPARWLFDCLRRAEVRTCHATDWHATATLLTRHSNTNAHARATSVTVTKLRHATFATAHSSVVM